MYVLSFMYALSGGSQCYAHTLPLLLPLKGFKDLEGIVKMEEVRGAQENILSLESFLTPRKGIKYQDPLKKMQPSHQSGRERPKQEIPTCSSDLSCRNGDKHELKRPTRGQAIRLFFHLEQRHCHKMAVAGSEVVFLSSITDT